VLFIALQVLLITNTLATHAITHWQASEASGTPSGMYKFEKSYTLYICICVYFNGRMWSII